jgi:hypothetical protein
VDARLGLEIAVGVRPADGEARVLDPRAFSRLQIGDLRLEAAALAPAEQHAVEHLGPVLCFEAAGARVDRDDRVAGIVLAAEHLLDLQVRQQALRLRGTSFCLAKGLVVAVGGHLDEDLAVVDRGGETPPLIERALDGGALPQELLRVLGIPPEILSGRLVAEVRRALLEASDVKDASAASRDVTGAR